jgi:hypothetical protein
MSYHELGLAGQESQQLRLFVSAAFVSNREQSNVVMYPRLLIAFVPARVASRAWIIILPREPWHGRVSPALRRTAEAAVSTQPCVVPTDFIGHESAKPFTMLLSKSGLRAKSWRSAIMGIGHYGWTPDLPDQRDLR